VTQPAQPAQPPGPQPTAALPALPPAAQPQRQLVAVAKTGTKTRKKPGKSMGPPRQRFSPSQIMNRRIEVWEMHCCGAPATEIAKKKFVSYDTILRDIKWWEERLGENTAKLKDPAHAATDVGTTAAKLTKVVEDAWVDYHTSTNAGFRARFLQVIVQALGTRHKILAEAGYLPKVGHETEHKKEVSITFEARFGAQAPQVVFDDPKSCRRILDAAEATLKESARTGVPIRALLEDGQKADANADADDDAA